MASSAAFPTFAVCTAAGTIQLPYLKGWSLRDWTTTTLPFGLLKSLAEVGEELRSVRGYERQPAPRWALSPTGDLTSMSDVSFDVAVPRGQAIRLALFSDDVLVASGGIEVKDVRTALPGQSELIFIRGSLRLAARAVARAA